MASSVSSLLLLLCAINTYSEAQVTNIVDVSTSAANQIDTSESQHIVFATQLVL